MITDALVIGAGTAGLTAGIRLAQGGLRVTVMGTGEGCLPVASGTVDVLGYAPDPVESPLAALPAFLAANPDHPYRLAGTGGLGQSVAWFVKTAEPLGYRGELSRNRWVPTVLGGLRPTALVPASMAAADLGAGGEVVIAGIRGFRDLHPALLVANLSRAAAGSAPAIQARAVELDWPGSAGDLPAFRLARRLEDAEIRRRLVSPAPPPAGRSARRWACRRSWAGSGPPRSTPTSSAGWESRSSRSPACPRRSPACGSSTACAGRCARAGGRLLLGSTRRGRHPRHGSVDSVTITQASRQVEVSAGFYVLATGGFPTGGVVREPDGELREPVFGLPVRGPAAGEQPFGDEYLAEHPLDRAGLGTDADGRPLGAGGAPHAANLYAAGAVLAGGVPWREKSGEGVEPGHRLARGRGHPEQPPGGCRVRWTG